MLHLLLDDPTRYTGACFIPAMGITVKSYISPVHSSSGDCCQLYTVGRRHRLSGCHLQQIWPAHTRTHPHTHLRAHTLKCIFSECSGSRRTLRLSGGKKNALYMVRRARHLLHPLPHVYTHRKKKRLAQPQRDSHAGRRCTCAVYRLHAGSSAGEEIGAGGEEAVVVVVGGCCRVGRRVRRLSGGEFLLPSTRTPSALYDNARVQERQS